jgi:hypothetical protein
MVIFNSYVKFPEGTLHYKHYITLRYVTLHYIYIIIVYMYMRWFYLIFTSPFLALTLGSSLHGSLILKGWRRYGVYWRAWLFAPAMKCSGRERVWAASLRKAKNPIWRPLQSDLGVIWPLWQQYHIYFVVHSFCSNSSWCLKCYACMDILLK